MRQDGKLDYVEMAGGDLPATKTFYQRAFGWRFTDYGADYAAFAEGLDGGFYRSDAAAPPLAVLFAEDLEAMRARVADAGGTVTREIFSFPGGRRFHFRDPAGNEVAVWGDPQD